MYGHTNPIKRDVIIFCFRFVPGVPLAKPPAPPPAKKNPQRNNIAAIKVSELFCC